MNVGKVIVTLTETSIREVRTKPGLVKHSLRGRQEVVKLLLTQRYGFSLVLKLLLEAGYQLSFTL